MVKQLNGLVHWNRYFPEAVCTIALLLVSFQPAFGATKPDGTFVLTDGKEQFMSTLASMPYTSSGTGPVLYVLECSACAASQAFEKDWKGQLDGLEIRRILIAFNAATANETAYLARTRDINDFYAFMNHTKVAPPIKACNCPEDNKAIQAFKSVAGPFAQVLKPIMIKNGWPKDSRAFPQFMWETNGRVYVGAYSKNSFPEILTMLRPGSQTTQASTPPSRTPAHESVSTVKESAAAETTGQVMTEEKKNPEPAAATLASNSGSKSAGSGGSGPDVLGLRIGMSPAEVRAIFKSRILVSEELRKQFAEIFNQLTFNAEAQGLQSEPVPNGKYLSFLATTGRDEHSVQEFRATFGPVPEQERLIYFYRSVNPGNAPTFNIMEKTLVEKYGTPTNSERRYNKHSFSWVYDNNGTLYKAGDIKDSTTLKMCREITTKFGSSLPDFTGYGVVLKFEDFPARCGATLLDVQLDLTGDSADSLVGLHKTTMTGFNLAVHESKISKAISDKAASAASAAAIKKGQQQKPEF